MNRILIKCLLLLCFTGTAEADTASGYQIRLNKPEVIVQPEQYYYHSVMDRRDNKNANGKIMSANGSLIPVHFENGMENSLHLFASGSAPADSSLIPVIIIVDKLQFKDEGNISRHSLSMTTKFSVIRIIEGEEFVLFQTSGSPGFVSQGVSDGLAEKLVQQAITSLVKGFDDYAKDNRDQHIFARTVELSFDDDSSYTDYLHSDTIRWNQEYKLSWDDFRGKPDPSSHFSAQSNCMFSYRGSTSYKEGVMKLSLQLFPCFTRKASWVVAANKQDALLAHEQLHFDICELYIRKLKQAISESELSLLKASEQIKLLFDQAWADYQKTQALYDAETKHGIIEDEQKRWVKKVNAELDLLNTFATKGIIR